MSRLFRFLALILCAVLLVIPVAEAGYSKDSCPKNKPQNRVRGDLVFDMDTRKVLIEKNAKASFHPASLTKLMSLDLIFDDLQARRLRPDEMVPLLKTGGQRDGRTISLQKMTVREAVAGIATASLNNVLDGIAAKSGTPAFVARMNETAKRLGMKKTFFVNPTGWPTPQSMQMQRTTLHDLATLVRHVWLGYPKEIAQYAGKKDVTITGLKEPLNSTNNLLETSEAPHAQPYGGVIGGKTGYTCYSGWHLVVVYKDIETGRRMVGITVGHKTGKARDDHMISLLDEARPKLAAFARSEARRIEAEKQAALRAAAKAQQEAARARDLAREQAKAKVAKPIPQASVSR